MRGIFKNLLGGFKWIEEHKRRQELILHIFQLGLRWIRDHIVFHQSKNLPSILFMLYISICINPLPLRTRVLSYFNRCNYSGCQVQGGKLSSTLVVKFNKSPDYNRLFVTLYRGFLFKPDLHYIKLGLLLQCWLTSSSKRDGLKLIEKVYIKSFLLPEFTELTFGCIATYIK